MPGAALCATEQPDDATPPDIRRTGPHLYLRLRRHDYSDAELDAWADRIEPFLAAGDDAYVFFRHDEVGRGPELAAALVAAVERRRPLSPDQPREPSAGPKTTRSSRRSVMSWNVCGTGRPTKTIEPGSIVARGAADGDARRGRTTT